MKARILLLVVLAVLIAFPAVGLAEKPPDTPEPPKPGNKNPAAATPNLSFPMIATDLLQMFYQQTFVDLNANGAWDEGEEWILLLDETTGLPVPIAVAEVIADAYDGIYDGYTSEDFHYAYEVDPETGCAIDTNGPAGIPDGVIDDYDRTATPMSDWLSEMKPWYEQPVFMDVDHAYDPNLIWNAAYIDTSELGGANSWQADWRWETEEVVEIDFIDWGNPMENINPIVGQRFPVEVALFEKLDAPMTAYKVACLEYPGSKDEVFGTSEWPAPAPGGFTYGSYFATVLTNQFTAEVYNPDGTITSINLGPGIGPSGKMNFASGGGGWIPQMTGWHRIWLHVNDPLISFTGAIVNNDEHYILSTGCMAQTLNPNKLELTGIIGNSTYIDVEVVRPSGKKK